MVDILLYVVFFALLVLAGLGGYMMLRGGQSPVTSLFGQRPDRRLAVVEHASVDGRRRLVLVRRDDVEHLIMTGGPVDVVIETGIGERKAAPLARFDSADRDGGKTPPTFGRAPRTNGRPAQADEPALD